MTEDGYYEFFIAHNSEYLITNVEPKIEYVNTSQVDQNVQNINNSINNYENKVEVNDTIKEDGGDEQNKIEEENVKIEIVEDNFEQDNQNKIKKDNHKKNTKKIILFISLAMVSLAVVVAVICIFTKRRKVPKVVS